MKMNIATPGIPTETDQVILNSYADSIDGLAEYLGSSYELVLHSLYDYDHSVVKIINGFHTGRKVGSPITNLALEMLEKISQEDGKLSESYFSTNSKGEPLKSTTIAIRNKNKIIGLLCINCYLSTPYIDILKSMGVFQPEQIRKETFASTSETSIHDAVASAKANVDRNSNIKPSQKNKAVIDLLFQSGVFSLKNSVEQVAEELGLSINTVYLHLRTLRK